MNVRDTLKSSPVLLLGLAGLAYLLIKKLIPEKTFSAADTAAQKLLDTARQGYSEAFTAVQRGIDYATSAGPVQVTAKIILPGAQAIDPASVTLTSEPGSNSATFTYAGMRFRLLPRDSNGNYPAQQI